MKQETTLKDILEIIEFIRDNAATKEDLQEVKNELHTEMQEVKNELMNHIDYFVGLHERLELELTALNGKYQRLEALVHQIAKHVGLEQGDKFFGSS